MEFQTKTCQNCKKDFVIEPDDFAFYEKMKVPPPTWCPECRMARRLIWRNEKNLFKRECDATGKEIFSMFHQSVPAKVYEHDYWWSDNWNALDYGREYDSKKPFLLQIKELLREVPWFNRSVLNLVNSDYCLNAAGLKNCYLVFHATENENCSYCVGLEMSKDSCDNAYLYQSELCLGCFYCVKCYKAVYSAHCENCREIYFSHDCKNCSHCFGCVGLRNKEFHIFNEPYSKDEYFVKLEEFLTGSHENSAKIREKVYQLQMRRPVKYMHGNRNVNCSGNYVNNSKNVKQSHFVADGENLKYCQNLMTLPGAKDCLDYSIWGFNSELIYECSQVGINVSNLKFCAFCHSGCRDMEYSINCMNSNNLFGCVGLRNKQYCILNKQYSKDEYENLKQRVIADMDEKPYLDSKGVAHKYGEFFPFDLCPFAYNDSYAQEIAPMAKESALYSGLKWRDPDEKKYPYTIAWRDLPDNIASVDDSIIKEVILCKAWEEDKEKALEHNCSMAFRVIPEELAFYRNMNVPLPRKCFNSRHFERVATYRNPFKLWKRRCQCAGPASSNGVYKNTVSHNHGDKPCPNEFETSYAPDRPEIVYCESCYNAEMA